MNEPILTLSKINKEFKVGRQVLHVLKAVDLTVFKGEVVAVVGPSGAGKTTMLNIAGGLMSPTSGSVRIQDHELGNQDDDILARLRNQLVGFVFQLHLLLPEFTARENVALPGMIGGRSKTACLAKAKALLQEVGLEQRLDHRPGELSGGEQQRVAIARALMNDPQLLLADEPTGDLDGPTARDIHDLLLSLNKKRGQTFILVTHNPELADLADRIISMKDGKIEE